METNISSELRDLELSYNNFVVPPSDQGTTTKLPLIQRIPFRLRNNKNFAKHYEPIVIAIGPIHHHKECRKKKDRDNESRTPDHDKEYLSGEFKRGLAHLFINNFIKDKAITAFNAIKGDIMTLRKRYEDDVTKDYNDDKLALMLFVDGCAVLAFIAKTVDEHFGEDFTMKTDFEAFGAHDLLLLENQLPFEVLESLMNLSNKAIDLKEKVKKFIVRCMLHYDDQKYMSNYDLPAKPNHLLELLREKILRRKGTKDSRTCDCNLTDYIINLISKDENPMVPSFRGITELETAGIGVTKSGTSYLTDISLEGKRSLMEKLKLPRMIVDDWTAPKFLNLAAYEMCPDFINDFGISSYLCFMDSLIDKAEDVKVLREAGVLHNSLGSDQEVTFFNEISNDLVPNVTTYNDVKEKIRKHYRNNWMIWVARFFDDRFISRWTVIASVAGVLALFFTALETLDKLNPEAPSRR